MKHSLLFRGLFPCWSNNFSALILCFSSNFSLRKQSHLTPRYIYIYIYITVVEYHVLHFNQLKEYLRGKFHENMRRNVQSVKISSETKRERTQYRSDTELFVLNVFFRFRMLQYIPRSMHTVFAMLCFVAVLH